MGPILLNANILPTQPLRPAILLHPMIPGGAYGLNPRTALGQEWWDETRRAAELVNNHCCYCCGIHKSDTVEGWLEGHETYAFDYELRRMRYLETVSICRRCHQYVHTGRLYALLKNKEIDQAEFVTTILHGWRILRNADLWPTENQIRVFLASRIFLDNTPLKMMQDLVEQIPNERIPGSLGEYEEDLRRWTLVIGSKEFKMTTFGGIKEDED